MPLDRQAWAVRGSLPASFFTVFALFSFFAPLAAEAKSPTQDISKIEIKAKQLPLNSEDPAQTTLGPMRYFGGLELSAKSSLFGGLSGLDISASGREAVMVADSGYWLIADLVEDADGRLVGLKNGIMADLLRPDGKAMQGSAPSDAESVTLDHQGHAAYVSFENRHRVWRYVYQPNIGLRSLLNAVAEPLKTGQALAGQPANGGVETLVWHSVYGLIAISEESKLKDPRNRMAWVLAPGQPYSFRYRTPLPYVPTDAALMSDSRMAVLNRHANWMGGLSAVLLVADIPPLAPGALIEGKVFAKFHPPLQSDNFEGLAIRRDEKGRLMLYMVSDDNYSPMERTLLLKFELDEAALDRLLKTDGVAERPASDSKTAAQP